MSTDALVTDTVSMASILPQDLMRYLNSHAKLRVPEWVFTPGTWNVVFLRGVLAVLAEYGQQQQHTVWEVGAGTGANLIVLNSAAPHLIHYIYYSDYSAKVGYLARENLARNHCPGTLLEGAWDLTTPPSSSGQVAPKVDRLIACIPQMLGTELSEGDNLAHYYNPLQYPEGALWHVCGLGLIAALLHRAADRLNLGGSVVLNLAGRPGLTELQRLFRTFGYESRVVHSEVIQQDPTTSLASLVPQEVSGKAIFEFYADALGRERINATTAEYMRMNDIPVYHRLYVMEGRLRN